MVRPLSGIRQSEPQAHPHGRFLGEFAQYARQELETRRRLQVAEIAPGGTIRHARLRDRLRSTFLLVDPAVTVEGLRELGCIGSTNDENGALRGTDG
jgi:hypothetical protein